MNPTYSHNLHARRLALCHCGRHTGSSLLLLLLGCALATSRVTQAAPGGTLVTPREVHTATLLTTGQVLLAAGYEEGTVQTDSAELYSPATNKWKPTGSLNQARAFHAACRLADGRVLVAGGQAFGANNLNSAEIYDPAAGTWTFTGSMVAPRVSFEMILLPDGRVLAAGGLSGGITTPTAELYDPVTGTWTATGSLNTGNRSYFHLTLLNNGKVLLAGGSKVESELYDPESGTWSLTGSMSVARSYNIQVMLADGRVLVAGGSYTKNIHHFKVLTSSEIYDPATGLWMRTGRLRTARWQFTANLLSDGRVFAVGGSDVDSQALSTVEEYDPVAGTWRVLRGTSLADPRFAQTTISLLDGNLIVAGGGELGELSPEAELFVGPQ